jgi:enamine deaminase RidA (YjgF/YER057c/UK114 family)
MGSFRRVLTRGARLALCGGIALAAGSGFAAEGPKLRAVGADQASGTSSAVVVDGTAHLVHTRQLMAVGNDLGPADDAKQARRLLLLLPAVLREAGSGLDRVVKINVYARRAEALAAFRSTLAGFYAPDVRFLPAFSAVVGPLPHPDAALALDAVAVADPPAGEPQKLMRKSRFSVLPPGPRVYISGQADPGQSLAEATRKTLEGLDATLKFLKLDRSSVVQVKAFLKPIASAGEAQKEIAAYFGGPESAPPTVFVEWTMAAPIEIELIAAGGPEGGPEPVEFLTPPALKPSPVFSRVARVNRGDLIYVSGLYGPPGATGAKQVEDIFGSLRTTLTEAGSDFRHLVKATYYVSDDDASRALNDLRPRFYDPARPPAASKASVAGVGAEGRSVTLDMIAVPAQKAT